MIQFSLIALGLLGLALIILSTIWGLRWIRAKTIVQFPLQKGQMTFDIAEPGDYALCFYEARTAKADGNFGFEIIYKPKNLIIETKEILLKPQFFKNSGVGVEFCYFHLEDVGEYTVRFQNSEDLILKNSMLRLVRFFQKSIPIHSVEVLIKESLPTWKKILTLVFLVFGINVMAWGIVAIFHPEMFA